MTTQHTDEMREAKERDFRIWLPLQNGNVDQRSYEPWSAGYETAWQAATASAEARYGALIHWPDCWDTMAYPTLGSALHEIGCNPEYCTKLGGCDA